MKIILVGGGKVGTALARQLSEEGHSVTVVDTNKARVEQIVQDYDVLGVVGNRCHQVFGKWNGTAVLDDGSILTIQNMTAFCEHSDNRW